MIVRMREDLKELDVLIPCVKGNKHFSSEEIEGAELIDQTDSGEATVRLATGKTITLYSIDLDFDE